MGGGGGGRVRLDFLSAIAGRVGSAYRLVGLGQVQEKLPVDNSELRCFLKANILKYK